MPILFEPRGGYVYLFGCRQLKWILIIIPLLTTVFFPSVGDASKVNVAYGGVWTAGSEKNFPVFSRIQKKNPVVTEKNGRRVRNPRNIAIAVSNALERINKDLSFNILFETDSEERKRDIDYPYSIAVAITRDDVVSEKFSTPVATINKTLVNVGMVILIYQTVKDSETQQDRNTIVFSVPLVGYSMHLQGARDLSEEELDNLFIETATTAITEHLAQRLKKIHLTTITGTITSVAGGKASVDRGAVNGIDEGQKVAFISEDGVKIGRGTVVNLKKSECVVAPDKGIAVKKGFRVVCENIKGLTDETYQVMDFKISSKKAAKLFNEKILGAYVSQWFSDFLVERAGKAVLPSKAAGEWVTNATGASFALLVKDGQAHQFALPPPKHPIHLDLSGLNDKMIEGNTVNEIWAYKAWLKIDVPSKHFSHKFDETATKNVVHGMQQFGEKDEFFDLIHQLTAKAAKEAKL